MRISAPGKPANEQILKHDLCSIEKVEVLEELSSLCSRRGSNRVIILQLVEIPVANSLLSPTGFIQLLPEATLNLRTQIPHPSPYRLLEVTAPMMPVAVS